MSRPLLLFAPGAGAPSTSPWMEAWAHRLGAVGHVVRFDYPYALAGRRTPDRLPVLLAAHAAALAQAPADHDGPIVLIGKSMGGRIGCHLAHEQPVDAIVCLGYPLRPPRSSRLRDEVLAGLPAPLLLVSGTRDPFAPPDLLAEVVDRTRPPPTVHLVEGGDHSLRLRKRDLATLARSQDAVDDDIAAAIARWLAAELPR